jgi:hypothetical protein
MSSNHYRAIELAIIPRAGRLPTDLLTLEALSPVQHSLKAAGNLNWRMADHIADLIQETLQSARGR